ncbi:Retrovirus-related Pol polyprotein from transposon TNT 1-94 [Araneus ventricosus]|uniref:Retrovirus-related Pol polyprotein from transposon TNT 1-94 n=1 Tax=Araneus ventricosus TaxID=182803 RepID=A0A4Y2M0I3_ARAVE|nr:Retrovirus-related Pol polyprotein from transposon TNT 1-94 [Araneus ventricosus]
MDAELKYCVDQFDGTNFAVWERRIESTFAAKASDKFLTKQSAEPIAKGNSRRESSPTRIIHSDLCGPVEKTTFSGECYVLTFVDDFSRFCEVCLTKKKRDISVEIEKFLKVNDTIKRFRCHNAKEYASEELQKVARNAGVEIYLCPPYTPQYNGVAERKNRALLVIARAMLFDSKLPKSRWGYAIQAAAFLRNRNPCTSTKDCTPYELKYVYKGHDATSVRFQSNDSLLNNYENLNFLDGRYVAKENSFYLILNLLPIQPTGQEDRLPIDGHMLFRSNVTKQRLCTAVFLS